jgi:hypothetical protein
MIRVRVSSTYYLAKQDYIEYVTVNRAHIIYTGIIKQAMDSNGDIILFMSEYTYTRWCKGRTYYDDIDKCYKHSGCKVSKEIAEQYEHEELKRNLQKHIDIYENLC